MFLQPKYIVAMLLMVTAAVSFGQNTNKRIFTITGPEGNEPKILTLYQNEMGYLLAGTTKGLYGFDGLEFYKYPAIPDSSAGITAITEINDQVWLGFENGRLAILNNKKLEYPFFEEGYPGKTIRKILQDKTGIIWIATAGEGIYYISNKRMFNINADDGLSDNYVYDITLTSNGLIKAATDRGLNIISLSANKKNIRVFSSKDGLPDNIIRCLFETSNGFSWLGMQDAGVGCVSNELVMHDITGDWQYGQVNDILSTSSQIFIATEDNGLLVYDHDENNKITTLVYHDTRLKKVSHLFRDRESNVWVSGDNFLMRTPGSNIEMMYRIPKSSVEKVHSILCGTDKSIWFNTGNKVSRIARNGHQWERKDYLLDHITTDISCLYEDIHGTIWIGTLGNGVLLLDPSTGAQETIKENSLLLNSNIITISGRDSVVWISGFEGIVAATIGSSGISYANYTGIKDIGSNYINYILPDSRGRVWFATDGKGVTLFDKGKFVNLQPQTPKFGNVIYRLAEDPFHNIWYSTYKNGIVKYDGKNWTNYTVAQGLSDMNITGLANTKDNIVVLHRDKLDIINIKRNVITYIDDEQGISNINTDFNAYTADKEGNLYFIADSTICKYHASYKTAVQPAIFIDNIQLFLKDTTLQPGHHFSYNENNISFHYKGLYYSQPAKIMYQYKLEGYDKTWIDTKDKIKNFPQLPPGYYTFRVRTSLNYDFSLAQEASFSFVIENPFWKNIWFIILCILIIVGIVFLIIKSREKSINKLNSLERDKIRSQLETLRSQINPHFLFNSFNTLISEIEEEPSMAVTYVEKLSDFYRSIVMNREKDLITLEEELAIMNDYAFIQQKRYGNAIRMTSTVTKQQEKIYHITPLALQLLIENAIKHNVVSLDTPLRIEIFIDKDEYLVIRNNVTKKLQEDKGSRMGLQNIQKRYELLSKKQVVIEKEEKFFTVKIPLLKNPV